MVALLRWQATATGVAAPPPPSSQLLRNWCSSASSSASVCWVMPSRTGMLAVEARCRA